MTALKIILGIFLALFLLGLIRVGGGVGYSQEGLKVQLRVGWFHFQLYPRKRVEKKPSGKKKAEADKKKKPVPAPEEKEKKASGGDTIALVRQFLPLVGEAAGEVKRKICIEQLDVDFIAAGADAADAAMAFGYSNMVMGMIWPIFEQNFQVKEHWFRTAVDFNADSPVISLSAAISARVGQLVSFALRFGWKAFQIYRKNKPLEKRKKEAV